MSESSTAVEDLGDDVLAHILTFCDPATLITISGVSYRMRALALTKQLWIFLIENLIRKCLIEVHPSFDPEQLSTVELIKIIKKIVTGPQNWALPSPSPTVSAKIEMTISNQPIGRFNLKGASWVRIANGGRQIVVSYQCHHAGLEVWDVATQRCIWIRKVFTLNMTVDQECGDGKSITIAFLLQDPLCDSICPTGIPLEVVNIPILRFYEFRDPVIAGSMVVIPLARNSAYEVLLINWRDQTGIILGGFEGFSVVHQPYFYPRRQYSAYCLIVTTLDPYAPKSTFAPDAKLFVYSWAVFRAHWRPIGELEFHDSLALAKVTPSFMEALQFANRRFDSSTFQMSTLENPLWPGTYKITIYVSPPTAQRSGSATVLKYSYDPTTSVSPIRLLSAMPAGVRMTFDRFAYSGFAIGSEDVFDTKNHSIAETLCSTRRGVLISPLRYTAHISCAHFSGYATRQFILWSHVLVDGGTEVTSQKASSICETTAPSSIPCPLRRLHIPDTIISKSLWAGFQRKAGVTYLLRRNRALGRCELFFAEETHDHWAGWIIT
ncbi:hypothetical protein B0H13DRAFT_1874989 [Mycena leptocephala]|nr:hypothetical protein B0H13DRAFT_1874989 [Mycena leptocephala]